MIIQPLCFLMCWFCISCLSTQDVFAQEQKSDDPFMKIYREIPLKINDLIHTRLEVRFDYKKCYMYGKEWVTFKPHFYPTDSLRLDAKGMDIKNVSVVKKGKYTPLQYNYEDSLSLNIHLDRIYTNNEKYTIYVDYTAKPNLLKAKGSAAINQAKGLYFINADSSEKGKPVQIWTQGETEASSVWVPTIDKPDQKTTSEILMTVPAKYVTLSNGRLVSQKLNPDGTRTDDWKMELPHSPYLFMMAVGNFIIYHDHWRSKEVNYYLEPKYAPYAKQIFGMTPELMEYFGRVLNYPFPWNKYSQIVVRDYVSGAMENTTATLHGEYVQETSRELLDAYYDLGRQTIAHELFHQWFGDLVTCESWSNLTVNESFADFSEKLWAEHKYGKDEGGAQNYQALQNYLADPDARTKNLVRYHYDNKEDVFDVVSYQKGGQVLNMLRNYLGDSAFFKGLHIYLEDNAFKNAAARQLQMAEEEASGRDLNWFFNEWYYGAGHPVLDIRYQWDEASKTETVYLAQTQNGQSFKLPFAVDIYGGGKKERHMVWMNDKTDSLVFTVASRPDLVNVDGDKVMLCEKNDHKAHDEFVYQYFNAPLYLDRWEAIQDAGGHQSDKDAQKVMIAALKDKYYGLRLAAVDSLQMNNPDIQHAALPVLFTLAESDPNTLVRAEAMTALGKIKATGSMDIFRQALKSQSYAVLCAAIRGIAQFDPPEALKIAEQFENDENPSLRKSIVGVYSDYATNVKWPFVYKLFSENINHCQFYIFREFALMIGKIDNLEYAQLGILELKKHAIKYNQAPFVTGWLDKIKDMRLALKDETSAKAAEDAIRQINGGN